jgi:hypothetical protein
LTWHLTRVQDNHVSEIAGREQDWIAGGWHLLFGMPPDPTRTGTGDTSEQVGALRPPSPQPILDYHEAVYAHTIEYLQGIDRQELDRIIDYSYQPPVSVGVRLVSVLSDNLQHAGQARYLRGIIERMSG